MIYLNYLKKNLKRDKRRMALLVDLSNRKNIKIIHSTNTTVTDKEMDTFQKSYDDKFNQMKSFTEHCIKVNMDKNSSVSDSDFITSMQKIVANNKILKSLLKNELLFYNEKGH